MQLDKHLRVIAFVPGNIVLVKLFGRDSRLKAYYRGQFKISSKNNDIYSVVDSDDHLVGNFHVSDLKQSIGTNRLFEVVRWSLDRRQRSKCKECWQRE